MLRNIVCVCVMVAFLNAVSWADTVEMKNGDVYQGTIKKVYSDHVVLAEVRGELQITRSKIKKITYAAEEKNLLSMGHDYFDKGRYQEALDYYERALRIKPDYQETIDAILKVRSILFRKRDEVQQRYLQQKKDIDEWGESRKRYRQFVKEDESTSNGREVELALGFSIEKKSDKDPCRIIRIIPATVAEKAHFYVGDVVVKVDDVDVRALPLGDIEKNILGRSFSDVKITIERKVVLLRGERWLFQSPLAIINADVEKQDDAFLVTNVTRDGRANLAGMKEKDRIIYVEEEPASFMSIESFQRKLLGEPGTKIHMIVQRSVVLRRQT